MKSPPVQYRDDVAHALVEAFAAGDTASTELQKVAPEAAEQL
jgi:hypothetical protein